MRAPIVPVPRTFEVLSNVLPNQEYGRCASSVGRPILIHCFLYIAIGVEISVRVISCPDLVCVVVWEKKDGLLGYFTSISGLCFGLGCPPSGCC